MIKRVQDNISGDKRSPVVHVVREVVEVEQISEEVIAHPELRTASIRIAHRCKQSGFEAVVSITLLSS